MVSSPGNQSDLPTSPGEAILLCFPVGVVVVVTSGVVCKYLVVLFTSALAKNHTQVTTARVWGSQIF